MPSFLVSGSGYQLMFYIALGLSILAMAAAGLFFYFWNKTRGDAVLLIDKTDTWEIAFTNIKGKNKFEHDGNTYILDAESGLPSRGGKSLYVFSVGNPKGHKLTYKGQFDVDGKSLMAAINNELIRLMVKTKDSFKDTLMLFGSIGGIIAGISSVLILLKQFGIIR